MEISEFLTAERDICDNTVHYFNIKYESSSSSSLLNIKRIVSINKIIITYEYIINKDKLLEILENDYEKKEVKKSLFLNLSFNVAFDFLNALSLEQFKSYFKNYLVSITYKRNNIEKLNEDIKIDEIEKNNSNIYIEQFYLDRFKIKFNSFIYKNDILIGYGLFDRKYENHYIIIMNKEDISKSLIYKNGFLINTTESINIIQEINDLLENYIQNFFKISTAFEIGGNNFYTNIKLFIINALKKNNIEFKIIRDINIINTEKDNEKDIIYAIRLKKHISILIKLNQIFISLDTSHIHVKLLQDENILNSKTFLYFKRPIQISGACSYYSIKFLELIKDLGKNDIIEKFNSGDLLMKAVISIQNFFPNLDNRKFISNNPNEISLKNKNITVAVGDKIYYLDDNIYLNKFIKIKSLYKCNNLDIPQIIKEIIETQEQIILVNHIIKQGDILNNNLEIYPKFIEEIKSSQINYKIYFMEQFNKFLDKNLRIYEEEIVNAENIAKFAKNILEDNNKLYHIEINQSLKSDIFLLTIYKDMEKEKEIKNFYEEYKDITKFLICLPGSFKDLGGNNDIKIQFEEGSEFLL